MTFQGVCFQGILYRDLLPLIYLDADMFKFCAIFTNYRHSYVLCIHSYKIYFQSEILTGIIKDTAHMAAFPLQGAKCVFELLFASDN